MTRLIALTSPAMACGKSTVAQHLVDRHGFTRVAFATPLKRMIAAALTYSGYSRQTVERAINGDLKEHILWSIGGFNVGHAATMLGELGPLPAEVTLERSKIIRSLMDWGAAHYTSATTPRRLMQAIGTEWGRDTIHPQLWVLLARDAVQRVGGDVVIDDLRFPNELDMVEQMGGSAYRVCRPGAAVTTVHASEGQLDGIHLPEIWNTGDLAALYASADRAIFA